MSEGIPQIFTPSSNKWHQVQKKPFLVLGYQRYIGSQAWPAYSCLRNSQVALAYATHSTLQSSQIAERHKSSRGCPQVANRLSHLCSENQSTRTLQTENITVTDSPRT